MSSLNKAQLIGNLGADPEIRQATNGNAIANLNIATSEKWTDKNGEKRENTEWHRVVIFGKLADVVGQHVRKGDRIYVEGKIQTRKWQDRDGNDRYTTEIVGNQMLMLGGTQGGGQPQSQPAPSRDSGGLDDDIPF